MVECRLNIHLGTWYLRPEKNNDRRKIELKFLFFTLKILKNKPKR